MQFDWDPNKNKLNKAAHGIDFADVTQVFYDQFAMVREDTRSAYGEERYQIIGMSRLGVLFVVYTERFEDTIRIISARKAEKYERKQYEEGLF